MQHYQKAALIVSVKRSLMDSCLRFLRKRRKHFFALKKAYWLQSQVRPQADLGLALDPYWQAVW